MFNDTVEESGFKNFVEILLLNVFKRKIMSMRIPEEFAEPCKLTQVCETI
jgi:hypothetical protein